MMKKIGWVLLVFALFCLVASVIWLPFVSDDQRDSEVRQVAKNGPVEAEKSGATRVSDELENLGDAGAVEEAVERSQARLPFSDSTWLASDSLDDPVASSATARLGEFDVVASQTSSSEEGNPLRRYLLDTPGKYSSLVLIQELEATTNDGDAEILQEVAYVADHILVGVTEADSARFESQIATSDLKVIRKLRGSSAYLVGFEDQSVKMGSVEMLLDAVVGSELALTADADYVLFSAEVRDSKDQDIADDLGLMPVDGKDWFIDPISQSPVEADKLGSIGPVSYAPDIAVSDLEDLFDLLPSGARVLTFDPPDGSDGSFRPEVRMHNFVITTGAAETSRYSSVYVNSAYTSGFPNNGGNYLRLLSADQNVILRHKDHLPFDVASVDLSEYSTLFAFPKSILVKGTKEDGATVTQSFRTDGIMDGTGPSEDFERFEFSDSFSNIIELSFESPPCHIDNLAVVLRGQESPLPAPPPSPQIYNVNWNDDPHAVGEESAVSGPYSPSSINFGTPKVREAFGALRDRPLELSGEGTSGLAFHYGQIRLDLGRGASKYVVKFDVAKTQEDAFSFFFDGTGNFVRYNLGTQIPANFGEATQFIITADLENNTYSLWSSTGGSSSSQQSHSDDIDAIRFSLTDNDMDGGLAIDNVVVEAYGIDEPPTGGSQIITSPSSYLTFPETPSGSTSRSSLRIYNRGTADLMIDSFEVNSSLFSVLNPDPITILPGGSADIELEFAPDGVEDQSALLSINSNDPTSPVVVVTLRGTGMGVPQFVLSPQSINTSIDSGTVGQETVQVSNSGTGRLEWRLISDRESDSIPSPVVLNDPFLGSAWGLGISEQAGCDAGRAWNISSGNHEVMVAVIDTGVDLDHPDLAGNLLVNEAEIAGNGLDDDNNGFVDDVLGWNFSSNDNDPNDVNGHGTHVAGTISAEGDNGTGVPGVAWNGGILAIQFLSDRGSGYTSDAVEAVNYARVRGARVINASWGGGGGAALLQSAISSFCSEGNGLFVAAAGNRATNTNQRPYFPSGYPIEGVISVAASNRSDELASFSNYGDTSVELSAPGDGILSTYPGGGYASLRGTSMAAPHVSGAVALLMDRNPDAGTSELRYFLVDWVDRTPGMNGKVISRGRLNVYQSLKRVPDAWLFPILSGGIINPNDGAQTVPLKIDARALPPGNHSEALIFTTNDPVNPQVELAVDVLAIRTSNFNAWKLEYFGVESLDPENADQMPWSNDADEDDDGYSTLIEYILNQSPVDFDDGDSFKVDASQGSPAFVFTALAEHVGVNYTVCWSPNMMEGSWRSDQLEVEELSRDEAEGTITFKATCLAPDIDSCFFKIVAVRSDEI